MNEGTLKKPSVEFVRSVIRYDPDSGKMYWRQNRRGGARKDRECFCSKSGDGYLKGQVGGVHIKAHAVAWAIYYGHWHRGIMDHIDGDRHNNRINNLRVIDHQKNSWNRCGRNGSSSKYKGVNWFKRESKWKASITGLDGKKLYLGLYEEEDTAAKAYDCAARIIHGEYARTNFK